MRAAGCITCMGLFFHIGVTADVRLCIMQWHGFIYHVGIDHVRFFC